MAVGESGKRVLIADDNRDWADGLALLLRDQGYSVRSVYDGREAVEVAREFKPQVVILDVAMPKMTGYEAGTALSKQTGPERPVLIAVSARPMESGKLQAEMLAGFDHYLGKSASSAELLALLKNV